MKTILETEESFMIKRKKNRGKQKHRLSPLFVIPPRITDVFSWSLHYSCFLSRTKQWLYIRFFPDNDCFYLQSNVELYIMRGESSE